MDSIKVGTIIAARRKGKGITQEELACHLGVSKPAVSKWESGQSYPDILLLPVLAAYFNISVDELLGYEPQMTKEDVRKLCNRLKDEFACGPFEKVYSECNQYIKKYFSCWHLQIQLGLLLLNHMSLAGSQEKTQEIIKQALDIFERVEKNSQDVNLAKQALQMQALCYYFLQQPVEAIDILENMNEPIIPSESLLIKAYQMKGDNDKAKEYLQGYTFVNLINMLSSAPDYFQMYADMPERMEIYYQLFIKLCDIFEIEKLHPAMLLNIYLSSAHVYMLQGQKEKALDNIEASVDLIKKTDMVSFALKGNELFDSIEKYFEDREVDTSLPRNSAVIQSDFKKVILQNHYFAQLEGEERYQHIKKKLED